MSTVYVMPRIIFVILDETTIYLEACIGIIIQQQKKGS